MTLIAGVRGIRKSFIIADSRATKTFADGSVVVEDNAQKWMHFNTYSTIAVAGDASLGAFIAKYMADLSSEQQSFTDTKAHFDTRLEEAGIEFNRATGRYTKCAILLVGYDLTQNDDFDATRLGEVLADGVQRHGDGVSVNQSVDTEILQAMGDALHSSPTPLGRGSRVSVNIKKAVVIGYKVTIDASGVHIETEEADSFESLFYGMDAAYNRIELPTNVMSDLYFKDVSSMNELEVLTHDTIGLITFYKDVIAQRSYTGVGGNIFPVMMTEVGGLFYANELIGYNFTNGTRNVLRESKMIDGKLHYLDTDDTYKPYVGLLDIAKTLEDADYELDFDLEF